MHDQLAAHFASYKKGFDQFDPTAIASLYALPCSVLDADGLNVYHDFNQLEGKFSSNCARMKDMGYSGSEFRIGEVVVLGSSAVSINLGWRVQLNAGPFDFRTLYLCRQLENRWSIFNAVVYDGAYD